MSDTREKEISEEKIAPKVKRRWVKRLLYLLLFLLLLPVLISTLLHIPSVQNYTVKKVSGYLSDRLEHTVSTEQIDFSIFKGLTLKNFGVMTVERDTVINVVSLNVSLSRNLFSLLTKELAITSVVLDRPTLHVIRNHPDEKTNIEILLEKLSTPKDEKEKKKRKKRLNLSIRKLTIKDINLTYLDRPKAQSFSLMSALLKADVKRINLDSNIFVVNSIALTKPEIKVQALPYGVINSSIVEAADSSKLKSQVKPSFYIKELSITDGSFALNQHETSKSTFDPKHNRFSDIQLSIHELAVDTFMQISVDLDHLSFEDINGFRLRDFCTKKAEFTNKKLELPQLTLTTNRSNINGDIKLSFRNRSDLSDIMQRVILDADLVKSNVAIEDLLYLVPSLAKLPLFSGNDDKKIAVEGSFSGRLANLKANNLALSLPGVIDLAGNVGFRNLNTSHPLINLRMNGLQTSILGLKKLIPNFNPPANFNKLGNIRFTGNFDGYIDDFVAYGTIVTNLGTVKTDMRLDLKKGVDKATYSGDLSLTKFDLKKWTDNPDFGYVSFDGKVRDGKGLTLQNASADIEGRLGLLQFKQYDYTKININGVLDKTRFDGKISSSDLNFNFGFEGFVSWSEKDLNFDFASNVGLIDFQALKLSKEKVVLRGLLNVKGQGNNLDDFEGDLVASNIKLIRGDSLVQIDSLHMLARKKGLGKELIANWDESTVEIEGLYKTKTLLSDFQSILKKNYPYHTRMWNYSPQPISNDQDIKFSVALKNYQDLLTVTGTKLPFKADVIFAEGYLNSARQELQLTSRLPTFQYDNNLLSGIALRLGSKEDLGSLTFAIDSSLVNGKKLRKFNIQSQLKGDTVLFAFNSDYLVDSIQKFDVGGTIVPFENGYSFSLNQNDIKIYNKRWKINPDNKISLDKEYINIENFAITDGNRTIEVTDINNKGIKLNVSKFDVAILNDIINAKKLYFSGDAFANVRIANIFKKSPDVLGNILMSNLKINGDSYGELNLDISKPLGKPLDAIASFNNAANGQSIKCIAAVDLDQKTVNADIKARNVPLKIVEYFLAPGVENMTGSANLDGTVKGTFDNIKINTIGMTNEGTNVRVKVLGESYSFDNQRFKISDTEIDLNGATLKDSQGGRGYITGGLTHKMFKDFYLNASLRGENVIALNTTKYDNPNYYGLGKGNVNVDFTGSVDFPDLVVNAETTSGTTIKIPIQSSQNASDKSFITFIDQKTYFDTSFVKVDKTVKLDGVRLEMNLTMTPEAKVFLIFDEAKGDVIEAVGVGNLQINMSRAGDFDIFGEYEIREGKYLFTAIGIVNKPFVVREGGKVRWNGDPVNATLDIKADYQVRTDLSVFLAEYLVTPSLEQAAANRTEVNLQMIIGNTLFNPSIDFGLNFPDLTGDLKSYSDSKVRLLKENKNDLNNQVFGLIVFNSFLPSNTLSQVLASSNLLQSASVNTLSEWLSNQLSSYVTRFINESLEDNGLIAGIDFDINLRNNLSLAGVQSNQVTILPTEIEVKLKNRFRFLDERLSFDFGGNYVRESLIRQNYVVPEFTFRYALTPDRKLNLKVYGKYDLDEISVNSRRQRIGVGLRYRTEFGSMLETRSTLKKSIFKVGQDSDIIN